jgi:large repetitive protein
MRKLALCIWFATLALFTGCNSGPAPIAVTLTAPTAAQALDVGQNFSITATVSNDKLAKGATFSLSGAGALSNQTPTSATFTASATGNATITVASVSDPTKTQTIVVVVSAMPSITSAATFSPATEGTAYSGTIAVTGGAGALTYSVTVGSLPAGLSLNSSTGAITGTATGPSGAVNFTVQVKDSSTATPQTNSKAMSITINQPPAPQFTTTTLPADVEGSAYSQTLALTGGLAPFTYSISSGALPAGLSLNASSGAITGTATGPNGPASFTVKVVDSSNPVQSATQPLSIAVNLPPAPAITTVSLPSDVEGTAYNQTVVATGGLAPLAYSLSVGSLPAGLSLNSSTGAISGTPTGPNATSSFTVKVTDKSNPVQSASQALSIAVNLPPPPAITTSSLPGAVEFANYNQTVAATGFGTLHYSVSVGTLPAGLSLNAGTGAITGATSGPNATSSFTIQVTDSSNPVQLAAQPLSIAVSLPPAPSITTTTLPNGTVGANYNQTVAFTGGHGPFTWSISSGTLPTGFSLNAATGAITGSSSPANTYSFTVNVVDSSNPAQTASQALSISIVNGPLLVTPATLPTGAVNDPYPSTTLGASGGLPPYTWAITVGGLPAGLSLNSSTGAITGTPTGPSATANLTAQVTDSTNAKQTGTFSIIVNPALAITSTSLPGATAGTNYSTNLSANGGVTPYNWSISAGSLPTGMNLSGNTISGIPSTAGTVNFSIQVNDASGGLQTAAVSINVAPAPPLTVVTTSGSLPQGLVNSSYSSTQLNATGGFQPYTSWTVVAPGTGTLPPGLSLSSSGQIAGTPTTAGTYPFTVQVTDSATPTAGTAQANLSITIAATTSCTTLTGKESLLQGDYAFVMKGFDASGNPVFLGGVFVASGAKGPGNITAGTLDMNLVSGVQTGLSITSASSYNLGLDPNATNGYRGCMSIVTSAGTMNYRFSVDAVGAVTANVASDGHIIGFDAGGPFTSGILRQATPSAFSTSAITGNWAFGVAGARPANGGGTSGYFAAVGVLNLASGLASGVVDTNDNGKLDNNSALTAFPTAAAGITLSSGPYSIASNGRGTLNFTPTGSSSPVTNIVYVVSSSELLILNSDSQVNNSSFTGRALKQSGSFSNSSLTGNHVIYASGGSTNGSTAASRAEVDIVKVTSGSNFTFSGYQNDGGNISDPTKNSGSGTFSVASNGRVTLTVSTPGANNLPVFYLSSANTAFFLNSDTAASAGNMEPQVGSSFTNSSASGTYGVGSIDPAVPGANNEEGTVTFTPSSTSINGTTDDNNSGTVSPDNLATSTYAINSSGVGLLPAGCTLTGASANCENLFIVISPTRAVLIKVKPSDTTPVIDVVQQ